MADRRMINADIIESDAFTDLPFSARMLYISLILHADDDGFVNSPRKIQRSVRASVKDLESLIEKHFLLSFPSGVVAIKHWFIHNTLRADRKKPTNYQDELAMLTIKDNKAYTWRQPGDCQLAVNRQPKPQTKYSVTAYLTQEEFDKLDETYEDIVGLIDETDRLINERDEQTDILHPFNYTVAVAEQLHWNIRGN